MLFFDYVFWFFLYSFVGWVYESTLCSVEARKPVNRGFLNGPACPIYGSGAVLFLLLLGRLPNAFLIFFLGMLTASVLEYLTSWLMELIFHAKWWDYSRMRFQIHGRVCLIGAIIFGTFSVVLIKWLHPAVERLTGSISDGVIIAAAIVLMTVTAADTVYTGAKIIHLRARLEGLRELLEDKMLYTKNLVRQKIDRFESLLSSGEARNPGEALFLMLNFQERRVLNAFPRLRLNGSNEVLVKIKEALASLRKKKK